MPGFNVERFKQDGLFQGGARPSQFDVLLPGRLPWQQGRLLVQATSIPASTMGTIEVPYFGRKIKLAGDRVFSEWQTTVMNDENFLIRNEVEKWLSDINSHQSNVRSGIVTERPATYKQNATVFQYGKTGKTIAQYNFVGLYPSEVSTIELDWNTTDQIETFTITWQYDYWLNTTYDGGGVPVSI